MIVTDFITPSSGNEYILVAIQNCKFSLEEEIGEAEEAEEGKWWANIRYDLEEAYKHTDLLWERLS